ncbi:IS1 family transposase [uncultured Varibaculum sp.]|uniref:transposase-like zinc-binding domain-containing protein n=1 Tax=uncultured Varibaculum sp. TaxID=413896 RepID=UPI0035A719E1
MKGIFFVFWWSINAEIVRVFVCEALIVKCPTCGEAGVKRNGTTSKGLQRYRCTKCGASFCNTRPDISRKAQLDQFGKWLTGKAL